MRIKTKTTTHNEVEQASNIFETYALQFYLKHLCRNATNDRHPSTDIRTQNHPHFQELLAAKILTQISPGLPLVVARAPSVRPPGWCFSRLEVTKTTWACNWKPIRNVSRQNTYKRSYLYHSLSLYTISNSQPHHQQRTICQDMSSTGMFPSFSIY